MSASHASVGLVREFFYIHRFLVLEMEEALLVRNLLPPREGDAPPFVLEENGVEALRNAVVRPVAWHTLKFSPAVLRKSPEIFLPFDPGHRERIERLCGGEPFARVMVIPALPASDDLRRESVEFLRERGVTHVIRFSTVIAGLIERINPRQVYPSEIAELLRVLKFYRFFPERQATLPFDVP